MAKQYDETIRNTVVGIPGSNAPNTARANDAIPTPAINYLLKPVTIPLLMEALRKALK